MPTTKIADIAPRKASSPALRGKGLSQMQRMQISVLPDASSAICEPQLWRAASAIRNYTSGLVLSPLATAAARHCSSSSAYTWPTPQYLPPERNQGLIKSDRFPPSSGDMSERLIIPCPQENGAKLPPKLPFFESKATVEPKILNMVN